MHPQLRFAVCDDNAADRDYIVALVSDYLHQNGYLACLDCCESGEALLAREDVKYDLTGCLTREEGRFITVTTQSEPHLLSILVRNSFYGVVQQRQERLLSRKRKGPPGIGIASMEDVCARYGGSMQVQWDQSVFSVLFVLPLSREEAQTP